MKLWLRLHPNSQTEVAETGSTDSAQCGTCRFLDRQGSGHCDFFDQWTDGDDNEWCERTQDCLDGEFAREIGDT